MQQPYPAQQVNASYLSNLSMPDESTILMGNFAIINLFDVIQVIENSKVSGELVINLSKGGGRIYFNEGQIANARTGLISGIPALSLFLDLTEGSFEFKKTDKDYLQVIQAPSNTGLLIGLLTAKDEEAANL